MRRLPNPNFCNSQELAFDNMSTAKRRRGQSLHLDLPNGISEELPRIAALFQILFDVKAGYMCNASMR